jgi:glutamate-5-semialdehyde dehydrogenase
MYEEGLATRVMALNPTLTESVVELVEREALAARRALATLTNERVDRALARALELLAERRADILAANEADLAAAEGRLDAGALDRLRLDDGRLETIATGIRATATLSPIGRELRSWRLPNGLEVSERLIPIGVVGANFEARPNVAVDVATQVLKSGNAVVLRTGAAALETVTVLVDRVLQPGLEEAGADGAAVGLVRTAEHAGAEALVSLPGVLPLVILRGSGASTAALARTAAAHGVRALAHAEGGGVLYAHAAASPERLAQIARASLDRLGVCNRLNLALVDRSTPALAETLLGVCRELGIEVRSTAELAGVQPLDRPRGHEWASEPERVKTITLELVDGPEEALQIANEETSGLAAAIVTDDATAAQLFLDGYRGTAALWNATTRFTDGFELLGTPETGINVDRFPGPRGPVTYRDLGLRQYRIVGDGSQHR